MTTLSAGQSLGHYTILGPLGAGAMGEVWRARDTRLGREVAVKVLPSHFVDDEERLRRFEREARSLASLNHPCVAQIHGVDQIDDHYFLVLELVPGETLGERIARGPLPAAEALAICARIADGLEAAHEAGVIHRDLKPDNVRITPHGEVKLLDFGLARPVRDNGADASTDSVLTTEAGRLLGTPTYMAPEQARGRPIDRRVDVWAFGCVLYECLAGRRAFTGESLSDVLAAVLEHEPDFSALPPLPPAVGALLRRCLIKDPRLRLRDVGEARLLFDDPSRMEVSASAAGTGADARRRTWRTLASASTLVALVAWIMLLREPDPTAPPGPLHVTVEPPPGTEIAFSGDFSGPPVVSPDGSMIVFSATSANGERQLWLRRLDELEPQALAGTEQANFPFWSPDSREIGFSADLHLWRLDLASGAVSQVVEVRSPRGGAFTGDGRIIYAPSFRGGLSIVDIAGGAPTPLTTLDVDLHTSHRWPSMVEGTDHFVFSAVTSVVGEERNNALYLGSLDDREPPRRILPSNFGAQVVDGWLLHAKDDSLLAVRFELDSAQATGHPLVLAKGLAPDPSTWHAQFSASPTGVLAWRRRSTAAERETSPTYSWSTTGDRVSSWRYDGERITTYATGTPMFSMALSPDGRMLAMDALSPDGFTDIVVCPTRFGMDQASEEFQSLLASPAPPRRLTFLSGAEFRPVWSPDSDELVFRWDGDDVHPRGIYRKRIGDGSETLVRHGQGEDDYACDWTADGRYLVVTTGPMLVSPENDLIAVPLDGGPEIPLVVEPGPQHSGQVSPDGRWLAYVDALPRSKVLVVPFGPAWPGGRSGERWLVSEKQSSYMPRWSPDGDELFYMTTTGTLSAVDVEPGSDTFSFSAPRPLFQISWERSRTYDISPLFESDPGAFGRFLFLDSEESPEGPISVLLGWKSVLAAASR